MFDLVNLVTDALGTVELIPDPPTTFGYKLGASPRFAGVPEPVWSERLRAVTPGARIEVREHRPIDLYIPVEVSATTAAELPAAIGSLLAALDPIAAATFPLPNVYRSRIPKLTTIEVRRSAGGSTTRSIEGYLLAGGTGVPVRHDEQKRVLLPLVFRCPFPYWRVGDPVSETVSLGASDSTTAGEWELPATDSDMPMWPTFEFEFSSNKTTGLLQILQTQYQVVGTFLRQDLAGPRDFRFITRPDQRSAERWFGPGFTSLSSSNQLGDMFIPKPVRPGVDCEFTLINTSDSPVDATVYVQPLALTV